MWRPTTSAPDAWWNQITFNPAMGVATGSQLVCTGFFCDERPQTLSFDNLVPEDRLIEYRLTVVPVWNLGTFDLGPYDLTYRID